MIIVIDNYDSFTYNLVQCLGTLGCEITVFRNDMVSVDEINRLKPERIVISPGPGTPDDAGVSVEVIRQLGPTTPILGVCLGHQCIGTAFGGRIIRAPKLYHGKDSPIYHTGVGLYAGLSSPFRAGRYHSLMIDRESLPQCLVPEAYVESGEIMGVRHREYPIFGVQFHPESVLTPDGIKLLQNFLTVG